MIGAGRLGRAVASAATEAGLEFELVGRDGALAAARHSEAALLCVPDDEIATACSRLSAAIPPLDLVGHASGASGLDALETARELGAETFSLHPLQTIPDGEARLAGAPCAVAGSSERAERLAGELGTRLGMVPFPVPDEARAAYHAAASIASNFLVTLEEMASELLERSGIENARELLAPLVLRSAKNWAQRGAAALTGPIARGDEATVARHLEAIDALAPEMAAAYRALAERTRAIAVRRGQAG